MQTDNTSEASNEVDNLGELVYKVLLLVDRVGVGPLVLELNVVFSALVGLAELLLLAHLFSSNVR